MKKILIFLFWGAFSLAAFSQPKKVAVYVTGEDAGINKVFGSKLVSAFARSEQYSAVERTIEFLSQLSKEQIYQHSGAVDDSDLSRLGKQFGVQYVCVAEISDVFGEKFVSARLIDVETAEIVNMYDVGGKMNDISECIKMANEIAMNFNNESRQNSISDAAPKPASRTTVTNNNISSSSYTIANTPLYKKDYSWKENPTITNECIINVALFHEAVKNGQYKDAYIPWLSVYDNCPNANKAIFTDGVKILRYKIEQASNDDERTRYINKLIEIYDKRIFYFGNDSKYPTAYILGEKALDYIKYATYDKNTEYTTYPWLKESANKLQDSCKPNVLTELLVANLNLYRENPNRYQKEFEDNYSLVYKLLTQQINNNNNKYNSVAKQYRDFADELYTKYIELKNK